MAADMEDAGSMTLHRRQAIRRRGFRLGSKEQDLPYSLEDGDGVTTGKLDRNRPKTVPVAASCPSRSSVDLTPTLLSMYDKFASGSNGSTNHEGSNGVDRGMVGFNRATTQQSLPSNTSVKLLAKEESRSSADRSITAMEGVSLDLTDSSKPCNGSGQKRPLSISSTSSSSSSSLPTNYRYKRPNLGDYETANSNKRTLLELADSTSISNTSTDSLSISESWSEQSPEREHDNDDSLYEHIEVPAGPSSIPLVKVYSPQNSTGSSASQGEDETLASSPNTSSRHKHAGKSGGDNSFGATSPQSPEITVHQSNNHGSYLNGRKESPVSPIFGPVSPLQLASLTKDNRYLSYAQRVASEIVETEKLYVNSLKDIIEGYMYHVNNCRNPNISKEDSGRLFGNLEEIYAFSKELLRELEECGEDPMAVARCFVDKNERFEIYTNYCTNYPDSMEVLTKFMLQPHLAERFKQWQAALGHGLPLGAYLLKPVQRILKYHLLLQNIVKNSEEDRPGYDTLTKALDHMTHMAKHINEMKRRHEHAVRVQEVQSQLEDYEGPDLTTLGELVLEGSFRMIRVKGWRSVFLFEKGILITKRKEEGMFSCKTFISCSNLMLVESISKEPLNFHVIPFDNTKMQHTLQARNIEMKRKWCQEIKRLIIDSYQGKIPDKVKSLVMGLGKGRDEDEELRNLGFRLTAEDYDDKKPRRKSGPTWIDLVKLKKPHRKNETTPPRLAPLSGPNQDSAVNSSGSRLIVKQTNQSMSGSRSMDNLSVVGSTRRHSTGTPSSHSNNEQDCDRTPPDNSKPDEVENEKLEQAKLEAANAKRAQSFKRATRFHPVTSLDLSDTEIENLSSAESMETSSDDEETVKPYSEDDTYVDLVYNNNEADSSGYDGYSNLMYSSRGASMPVLNGEDEDYVTVNLKPEDGIAVSSESHLKTLSLTREDCSRSAECLTTNPTKRFSNLIYQNVDFQNHNKDSQCSSTNSSYDNLNKRWSNGSSHKADDEEEKPTIPHQQTRSVQRVKKSSSSSCSTHLPKEKKPCDSEKTLPKDDPWEKNPPPAPETDGQQKSAVADGDQKPKSTHKKLLCPIGKSFSFPLSSDVSKKISKENYDWFVYTNRVGSTLSSQFEKLLVYDKYGTRPRGLMAPSKFPAYVSRSSAEEKYDLQQKKTIVRYGTPPRNAMSSETMNSFSPIKGDKLTNKLTVKRVPEIAAKPVKKSRSTSLSTPRAWEFSGKEKFKLTGSKQRPASVNVGVIEDSKKIVEEMEKYVQKNDPLRGSSSSLGKFPSSSTLVSPKNGEDSYHKLIHDHRHIDRSRESLSNKSRDSVSSGGGNFMSLSRESLTSSTGSSTRGRSSMESSVITNLNQSGAPADGFVGSLRSKLSNLTSRLATRKPTPTVNSSNVIMKPGRSLSHGHFTSTFNARYKTQDQGHHKPEGMVSHLAKIYNVREKENTPSPPASRKRDSSSPEKNIDYATILRNRQLGSSALGSRIASSTSLHMDPTYKAKSVSPSPPSHVLSDTETCSDTMSVKSVDLNIRETSPDSPYRKRSEFSSNNIQQCDSAVSIPSGCDLPPTTSERHRYVSERRSSCNSDSSGASTDSIYERRLSQALDEPDDSVFRDSAVYSDMDTCSNTAMPPTPQQKAPRKSIREVVQQLEEKAKPKHVEVYGVRRREPGRSIQEKLKSLQESSQYHNRRSQTFDEDGTPMPRALRDIQQSLSCSRSSIEREEPGYTIRYKYGFPGQDIGMKSARSTSRLDQIDNVNTLINMKGWVRQLISKFQAD